MCFSSHSLAYLKSTLLPRASSVRMVPMVACARVDRFSNSLYSRTFVWRVWTGDVVMWTTDDVPVCFSSHSLACLKECHCVKHAPTSAGTLPHPANAPAVLLLASASIPGSRSRTEIDDLSANTLFAPTVAP